MKGNGMKGRKWEFSGGSIQEDRSSRCEAEEKVEGCVGEPIFKCEWGGGWEYEPSYLCRIHLLGAIRRLAEIAKEIEK